MATITARSAREIKRIMSAALTRPHWQLVTAETDKKGNITSVIYELPAGDVRFKATFDEDTLQRKQQSAAAARAHKRQ